MKETKSIKIQLKKSLTICSKIGTYKINNLLVFSISTRKVQTREEIFVDQEDNFVLNNSLKKIKIALSNLTNIQVIQLPQPLYPCRESISTGNDSALNALEKEHLSIKNNETKLDNWRNSQTEMKVTTEQEWE